MICVYRDDFATVIAFQNLSGGCLFQHRIGAGAFAVILHVVHYTYLSEKGIENLRKEKKKSNWRKSLWLLGLARFAGHRRPRKSLQGNDLG